MEVPPIVVERNEGGKVAQLAQAKALALDTLSARAPPRRILAVPVQATDIVAIPPPLPCSVPPDPAQLVVTPLRWLAFQQLMRSHPNPALVSELVHDLQHGVRVGYQGPRDKFRPAPNLPIEESYYAFVDEEIRKEVELGRRVGPFDSPPFPNLIVSPIGVVTKKLSSKLRMIHHLSWPRWLSSDSGSVNQHIRDEDCETVLQSFDDAIAMLASLPAVKSHHIRLSKVDVKSAYRLVPVHPDDWHLLGMQWRGKYYYDKVLVFGLSSSCQLWERVATAVHWIAKSLLGLELMVHYIDDFLIIGTSVALAELQLKALLKLFAMLGVPLSLDKLEGPTQVLPFLGIEINTRAMTIGLDAARLSYVQDLLTQWLLQTRASIKELESLIGTLSFCAKVIRPGRIFLRRLINFVTHLFHRHKRQAQTVAHPLTDSVKKDVVWWHTYMSIYNNQTSIYPTKWCRDVDMQIATDAGQQGYGGVFGKHWFHGKWTTEEEEESQRFSRDSMPWKELHTLVRAAAIWGAQWKETNIVFHLDCEPMVFAVMKGGSKHPDIMSLLRTLSFLAAQYNFQYRVEHVPGHKNVGPDHLSRGRVSVFQELFPLSDPCPTPTVPLPCHPW
jgi:hypothetical protein